MSRIMPEITCKNCGHVREDTVSFGHPESDFDYNWSCKCGANNIEKIKAWIDINYHKPVNDIIIFEDDNVSSIRIFTSSIMPIPCHLLVWRPHEDKEIHEFLGNCLTLAEISTQIKKMGEAECSVVV